MAVRRTTKAIDISDVDGLLKAGKKIRAKYKALKKRCDDAKDGEVILASELRALADELKAAIDAAASKA